MEPSIGANNYIHPDGSSATANVSNHLTPMSSGSHRVDQPEGASAPVMLTNADRAKMIGQDGRDRSKKSIFTSFSELLQSSIGMNIENDIVMNTSTIHVKPSSDDSPKGSNKVVPMIPMEEERENSSIALSKFDNYNS